MNNVDSLLNARKCLKESEDAELHGDFALADAKAAVAVYWLNAWRDELKRSMPYKGADCTEVMAEAYRLDQIDA